MSDAIEKQISARLDRDHFVANIASFRIVPLDDVAAVNAAADDCEVLDLFAPHECVMKMTVTEVLIFSEFVRLRRIVASLRPGDDRVLVEDQANVALQMD